MYTKYLSILIIITKVVGCLLVCFWLFLVFVFRCSCVESININLILNKNTLLSIFQGDDIKSLKYSDIPGILQRGEGGRDIQINGKVDLRGGRQFSPEKKSTGNLYPISPTPLRTPMLNYIEFLQFFYASLRALV